ncbi:MAG: hypothetical protein CBARDCOR_1539 [uncultured Caballeronia sp.]|nr:MAG: hypothetical protein CBARDCOR_1539 [uncultured Caballeronia sp.]
MYGSRPAKSGAAAARSGHAQNLDTALRAWRVVRIGLTGLEEEWARFAEVFDAAVKAIR